MDEIRDTITGSIVLLLAFASIFLVIIYLLFKIIKNKKYAILLERLLILLIFTSSPQTQMVPFSRINPGFLKSFLLSDELNSAVLLISIPFYLCFLIVISRHFSKESDLILHKFFVAIKRDFSLWILIFLGLLSQLWSETPGISFVSGLSIFLTSILAAYIAIQYSWKNIESFLKLSLVITALSSLVYAVAIPSLGTGEKGWNGIFGFQIFLGMTMGLSAVVWLISNSRSARESTCAYLVSALSIFILLRTNSASGILVLSFLICVCVFFYSIKLINKKYHLSMFAFSAFIIVSLIGIIPPIISGILEMLGKSITLTGRTEFWPLVIDAIMEKPFLGYGVDGFWQPWRGYENPAINIRTQYFIPPHSHNGFLDLGLNLGIVGLLLFMFSCLKTLSLSIKHGYDCSRFNFSIGLMPLVLISFVILAGSSESGPSALFAPSSLWFYYVLISVKLRMVDSKKLLCKSLNEYRNYCWYN